MNINEILTIAYFALLIISFILFLIGFITYFDHETWGILLMTPLFILLAIGLYTALIIGGIKKT